MKFVRILDVPSTGGVGVEALFRLFNAATMPSAGSQPLGLLWPNSDTDGLVEVAWVLAYLKDSRGEDKATIEWYSQVVAELEKLPGDWRQADYVRFLC